MVISPMNAEEIGNSLMNELERLSKEDWDMIDAMKRKPTRALRITCTMAFDMNEEDSEGSLSERIISELDKLHSRWLEYETSIIEFDPVTGKRIKIN